MANTMTDKIKRTAAVSAVLAYIRNEEDALIQAGFPSQPEPEGPVAAAPAAAFNMWGISGRQQQMQMRTMMQIKAFHGARVR